MGAFNTVYIECPHCGEDHKEQFKPGQMDSYIFGVDKDIPLDYLQDINGQEISCWNCGNWFMPKVELEIKIGEMTVEKKIKD